MLAGARKTHWRVLAALCWFCIAAYILYPLCLVMWDSIHDDNGLSIKHFQAALSGNMLEGIGNSLFVSLCSCIGAAVIGIPASLWIHNCQFKGRRLLLVSMFAPLLLPPLIGMFAIWLLVSDIGFIPNALGLLFGSDESVGVISGIPAVILVHAYSFSVYYFALCSASLQRRDHSLIEAARSLGAKRTRIFTSITLPHILPSIISASALTFMLSMGSFSAPYILANATPFLSVSIYEVSFAEGGGSRDFGLAAALSVIGACICIAFLLIARRFQDSGHSQRGLNHNQLRPMHGWPAIGSIVAAALVSFVMLLPLLYIVIIAFCDYPRWDSGLLPSSYTLKNFTAIFQSNDALRPLLNSCYFSAIALVACLLWCFAGSQLIVRSRLRGSVFVDICMMLPLALPGTVIAFSLVRAFSEATPQTFFFILAHGTWLLPLAYCIRSLPLALRPLIGSLESADPAHDEAARSLGASAFRRFWSILLPHMRPAILAAAILVFVTNLGEFVASIMIYRHDNLPISVYIYQQLQSGIAKAAAYSVLLILIMLAAAGLRYFFQRPTRHESQ